MSPAIPPLSTLRLTPARTPSDAAFVVTCATIDELEAVPLPFTLGDPVRLLCGTIVVVKDTVLGLGTGVLRPPSPGEILAGACFARAWKEARVRDLLAAGL